MKNLTKDHSFAGDPLNWDQRLPEAGSDLGKINRGQTLEAGGDGAKTSLLARDKVPRLPQIG